MEIKMNFCPACGHELNDDYAFCPECGYKINAEAEEMRPENAWESENSNSIKIKCPQCGELMPEDLFYCLNCGHQFKREEPEEDFEQIVQRIQRMEGTWKNKWVSLLLCILFGWLGIHRFYEGKIISGILYLVTLGFWGIGWIVDIIRIALKPNPYRVD